MNLFAHKTATNGQQSAFTLQGQVPLIVCVIATEGIPTANVSCVGNVKTLQHYVVLQHDAPSDVTADFYQNSISKQFTTCFFPR